MKAIEIMSKWHDYDLDFNMDIKYNYGIRVNNLASFGICEVNDLRKAGFRISITSNLGHTDDGCRGWRGAEPHPTSQPPLGGFITGPRNDAQPKEKAATPHY